MTEPQLLEMARMVLKCHEQQSSMMRILSLLLERESDREFTSGLKNKLIHLSEQLEGFANSADEARAKWTKELGLE